MQKLQQNNDTKNSDLTNDEGHLLENILHFSRVLRSAGLPIGTGQVVDGILAVECIGFNNRKDLYFTLESVFVSRYSHRYIFDQAFHIFWKNPNILERVSSEMLPNFNEDSNLINSSYKETNKRIYDAFYRNNDIEKSLEKKKESIYDSKFSYSDKEKFNQIDFETMSSNEIAQAKIAMQKINFSNSKIPTRRFHVCSTGKLIDIKSTIKSSTNTGSKAFKLRYREKKFTQPSLVVLCDISGSMSKYSRMFLHFMHSVTSDRDRVFTFVFGTQLTNVTRQLRSKDIDIALNEISSKVKDWAGGTRIGNSVHEFNKMWSRRLLSRGSIVLMISDGLDQKSTKSLSFEMERLHNSCKRLIWLNPLLRYKKYEAKAAGAAAILPHVDDLKTIHNLESIISISDALSEGF